MLSVFVISACSLVQCRCFVYVTLAITSGKTVCAAYIFPRLSTGSNIDQSDESVVAPESRESSHDELEGTASRKEQDDDGDLFSFRTLHVIYSSSSSCVFFPLCIFYSIDPHSHLVYG